MKRRVVAIAITLLAVASIVFAGSNGLPSPSSAMTTENDSRPSLSNKKPNRKSDYVDMKSDEGWQMTHNGKKIMVVVGNFAAHHNGTVITADSAVRYSERHIECFGNVLINKGTTYIYGDRAEYNGDTNEAKVFSNIVKVVDGSATLLTYNFTFNTKSNIGHYTGGGVLVSNDNILESERGYVYSDKHQIICVDRVQMQNNEYDMLGDSVVYNTESDFAEFFTNTHIWNKGEGKPNNEQEYLFADRGSFDKAKQLYKLTLNGYVLTKEQEMMSDSVDYYRDSNYVLLRRNIQIDDISQKMLIFADWGEYWREKERIFATREPVIVSYDTSQSDSVFIRSDSMWVYTIYPIREKIEKARQDSLAMVAKMLQDSLDNAAKAAAEKVADTSREEKPQGEPKPAEEGKHRRGTKKQKNQKEKVAAPQPQDVANENPIPTTTEPTNEVAKEPTNGNEKTSVVATPAIDSVKVDTTALSKRERAKILRREAAKANQAVKEALKQKKVEERAKLKERNSLRVRLLGEARVRDAERKRREKALRDSLRAVAKLAKDSTAVDSLKVDSLKTDTLKVDSLKVDSLKADSLKVDSLKRDSVKINRFDTMTVKQVKAYFQAIADREKDSINRIKQDSLDAKLDRIADARQAKRTAIYKRWERQDSIARAKSAARAYEQLKRRVARREKRGIFVNMADSTVLRQIDSLLHSDIPALNAVADRMLDSLIEIYYPREIPSPAEILASDSMNIDSFYRDIRAYSHVRMYRSDAQSVCDSLSTTTLDSIIHLYKSPVLWNGANQITSDIMHLRTSNSRLEKAQFEGSPLTASQIDTAHYNQVTGKEMTALFRNNEIYRNDVNGNVQTIYYMQEDNSPEITMMAYIEAGDMTSYIEKQQITGITYRGNPTYTFYPMDKIPESQPTRLPNFKWEANRRPTRDSVLMRIRRPSQREERGALRRPLFPINALMQQRRDDYMRRGEWRDRTDTLTIETIEWLETIRSEYNQ